MAKQASPTMIGGFVVGATVFAVAGVLIFGGGSFFEDEMRVVMHFEEGVTGLEVGAPVRFRGVPVGDVVSIRAVWGRSGEDILIPVEVRLVEGRINAPEGSQVDALEDPAMFLETAVRELGLRAELQQDSFVTGKLFVALDFLPDTEIVRSGGTTLLEIPTIPSEIEQIKNTLEAVVADGMQTLAEVRTVISDPRIGEVIESISSLARTLDENVAPIAASTHAALDELLVLAENANTELDAVSEDAQTLLTNANVELEPLVASAADAVEEARVALANINATFGTDKTILYQLADTLQQMADAARSIRVLADYIERHPEALLSGKEGR